MFLFLYSCVLPVCVRVCHCWFYFLVEGSAELSCQRWLKLSRGSEGSTPRGQMALGVADDEAHLLHLDLGLHLTALLERTTGPVDAACAWCESVWVSGRWVWRVVAWRTRTRCS